MIHSLVNLITICYMVSYDEINTNGVKSAVKSPNDFTFQNLYLYTKMTLQSLHGLPFQQI